MPPRLTGLPYEVLSSIVEGVSFTDTVNLAHSSKQLQFLEREDNICRKILEVRRFHTFLKPGAIFNIDTARMPFLTDKMLLGEATILR